jgi:integrase
MAEARRKLRAKLAQAPSGTPSSTPPSGETVAEYLARWRSEVARHRIRPRTLERYRYAHQLALPLIGDIPLVELTPDDVQDVMNAVLRSGRAPQTAKHVHTALRSALRDAEKRGLVARNVAALVDAVRVPQRPVARLSAAQVRGFLDGHRQHPHYAIWVLALTTGMRRGEILSLRWSDIDLARSRLTIAGSLRRVSKVDWDFEEPKTDRARRTLSLSRRAVDALAEHRVRAASAVLVFTKADGKPLEPSWVSRTFSDALVAAGLPRLVFHASRHTAASLMLDSSGGDLRLVMSALGHSTIATTVDRYGGIAEQAMRKAADAMDEVLGDGRANIAANKTANGHKS